MFDDDDDDDNNDQIEPIVIDTNLELSRATLDQLLLDEGDDYMDISTLITRLVDLSIRVEKLEAVKVMKSIVPEFISKNSEYEKLDK